MNKGKINQLFQSPATYRIPKLATLVVTSCLLLAVVSLEASASTSVPGTTKGFVSYQVNPPIAKSGNPFDNGSVIPRVTSSTSRTSVTKRTDTTRRTKTQPLVVGTSQGHSKSTKKTTNGKSPTRSVASGPSSTPAPTTTTTAPARLPTTTIAPAPLPTTTTTAAPPAPTTTTTSSGPAPLTAFPVGVVDSSEPSGYAPPAANALAGYNQSYVTDFTGSSLPSGWGDYTGTAGGDPGSQWAASQVVVGGGLLSLNTAVVNGALLTGGVAQDGVANKYGAWFVRSRITGAGSTQVELLWPSNGSWPPEIDFNETGGQATSTTATNIWAVTSTTRSQAQDHLTIDMTQWHTWGVIWSPSSIILTVDGQEWGSFTTASEIPNIAMWLTLQQQTWCSSNFACPTTPDSMQIDWVAEYQAN
jgi:hypothetical protein